MSHPVSCSERFNQTHSNGKKDLGHKKQRNRKPQWQLPDKKVRDKGTIHGKLEMGHVLDQTQVKAAVVQYHDFMHHRQFQMGLWIIIGHPAIFNHGHHYKYDGCQSAQHIGNVGAEVQKTENPLKRCLSSKQGKRPHQYEKCRFNQHGIQSFPARTHSFKAASRIQSGDNQQELAKCQGVCEHNEIAIKRYKTRVIPVRNHQNSHQNRGCISRWSDPKDKAGGLAVHRPFFPKPEKIFHGLKKPRPFTSGSQAFCANDDAHKKQARQQNENQAYHVIIDLRIESKAASYR